MRPDAGLLRTGLIGLAAAVLAGCGESSEAERYQQALVAPSWERARALCETLAGTNLPDCLLAAMERHDRLERADCAIVSDPLWRDECLFLFAERAHDDGEIQLAFAACAETGFGRECSYHLIRDAAKRVLDEPVEKAAVHIKRYESLPDAPDAPWLFWRAWHRERSARRIALDPAVCADDLCRGAAREALLTQLTNMASARPGGFCDGEIPSGTTRSGLVSWVDTPQTRGWVEKWIQTDCARRRDPPANARHHPSPHQPVIAPVP